MLLDFAKALAAALKSAEPQKLNNTNINTIMYFIPSRTRNN
jgi:hypothetical protein